MVCRSNRVHFSKIGENGASDPVLAKIRRLVAGHPALVHAEVELLQAQRRRDRRLAAGVLHPQPRFVLPEHQERLAAPGAQGAYVSQVGHLVGGYDPPAPSGAQLLEAVGRGRAVQRGGGVARRTDSN